MKIIIIGGGWLGKPLALDLVLKCRDYNCEIVVSNTSGHDMDLEAHSIKVIKLNLMDFPKINEVISNADVIIYTVPPLDLKVLKSFFDQIDSSKKIIFTSSISVYSKNMGVVDENQVLKEETSSSPLLVSTEAYLNQRFSNLCILRLGGLYGLKRHPVFFLAGRSGIKTGNEFLHLASLNDCKKAIIQALQKNQWGEVFNIVSDLRILKKNYYSSMVTKLKLMNISFDDSVENKTNELNISNVKSKNLLQMSYENPIDYLQE